MALLDRAGFARLAPMLLSCCHAARAMLCRTDLGLASERALGTGGSRAIGFPVRRALAAEGARVALLGRDVDALAAAAVLTGPGTLALVADTTDDTTVRAAVDAAASGSSGLDVVVNAAAPRARPGPPGPRHRSGR